MRSPNAEAAEAEVRKSNLTASLPEVPEGRPRSRHTEPTWHATSGARWHATVDPGFKPQPNDEVHWVNATDFSRPQPADGLGMPPRRTTKPPRLDEPLTGQAVLIAECPH